ncbi:2TM domain-containing protein [Halocola ammonii]
MDNHEKLYNDRYQRAKQRVEEEKGFYGHLLAYIAVNIGLFLLNLVTAPGHWWFYWPLLGWGIGLLIHGVGVFGRNWFFSEQWEQRKIKKYMNEEEDNG